jgi:hypothetical protein
MARDRVRVLTLYLVRGRKDFDAKRFLSVVRQRCVEQDVFIVSAEPIPGFRNNIVVRVPGEWPVPVRVAYSINKALIELRRRGLRLEDYDYLFKVDGDVVLPEDYVAKLVERRPPVAGKGVAMLISTKFFRAGLRGRYPISHCDDSYILSRAVALGYWPREYTGPRGLVIESIKFFRDREYAYGAEYYKWGMPFTLLLLMSIINVVRYHASGKGKPLLAWVWNIAGYLWAALRRLEKYEWSRDFARYRASFFVRKGLRRARL